MVTRPKEYTPWVKILTFEKASLNTYLDPINIDDSDWHQATNIAFQRGNAEFAEEWTAAGGIPLESGARIDGLHRSFDKFGNAYLIAAVNKRIKSYNGTATWTDKYTAFTVKDTPYSFINYQNKTLIINGTDDIVAFDPNSNTAAKYGFNPPRFFKRVAYFETDTSIEAITTTGTHEDSASVEDLVRFDPSERTGKARRSWRLTSAGTSKPAVVISTPASALNLSTYDNGETAGSSDFVCLSLWYSDRSAISSVTVDLYTGTAYYRATIPSTNFDPELLRDNIWTYHRLSRTDFAVGSGSPGWTAITKVVVTVNAVGSALVMNVDNIYITNAPMNATSYGKVIEDFGGGGWTYSSGMTEAQVYNNYKFVKMGMRALKVSIIATGAAYTMYKTVALDLSKYGDDVTSNTSDQICLFMYLSTTTGLTNVIMTLYTDASNYVTSTMLPGGVLNATTVGAETYIRIKKSDFAATLGTINWASITKIALTFTVTGTARDVFLDKWVMEEYQTEEEIATMESSAETWTFSSATSGNMVTDKKYRVKGNESLMLQAHPRQTAYASLTKDVNLSQFTGGFTSGADDIISFWVYWTNINTLKELEIRFDIGVGAVDYATDYYSYKWTKLELRRLWGGKHIKHKDLSNKSMYLEVKKSDFLKVGTTSANVWDDVQGIRLYLTTGKGDGYRTRVYFDDLHMRRSSGVNGLYQWAVVFCSSDGVKSGLSEWTAVSQMSGTKAVLTGIPVSSDTACSHRELYRMGGTMGDEKRFVDTIWDNTSTTFIDTKRDYDLGHLLGSDVPSGTIRDPRGKCFGPVYKGRLTMYQIDNQKNYLYFSNIGYGYAWNELQVIDLGSEIMGAWVDDDVLYVSTRNGVKKIANDLYDASVDPSLIQETGITLQMISPWGHTRADDSEIVATHDGAGFFNGYQFNLFSDKVKDLFDEVASYETTYPYMKLLYSDRRLYLYYQVASPRTFICDLRSGFPSWTYNSPAFSAMCIYDAPGDYHQVAGGTSGGMVYIRTLNDTSLPIVSPSLESKDFGPDDPFNELQLDEIHVIAKASMAGCSLVFQFKAEQSNVATATLTIADLTGVYRLRKAYLGGNEIPVVKGSTVGFTLTPSSGSYFSIKAIKLIGRVTPRTYDEEIL